MHSWGERRARHRLPKQPVVLQPTKGQLYSSAKPSRLALSTRLQLRARCPYAVTDAGTTATSDASTKTLDDATPRLTPTDSWCSGRHDQPWSNDGRPPTAAIDQSFRSSWGRQLQSVHELEDQHGYGAVRTSCLLRTVLQSRKQIVPHLQRSCPASHQNILSQNRLYQSSGHKSHSIFTERSQSMSVLRRSVGATIFTTVQTYFKCYVSLLPAFLCFSFSL